MHAMRTSLLLCAALIKVTEAKGLGHHVQAFDMATGTRYEFHDVSELADGVLSAPSVLPKLPVEYTQRRCFGEETDEVLECVKSKALQDAFAAEKGAKGPSLDIQSPSADALQGPRQVKKIDDVLVLCHAASTSVHSCHTPYETSVFEGRSPSGAIVHLACHYDATCHVLRGGDRVWLSGARSAAAA